MKKNKNLIALLICFCISIITYNIDNLSYYVEGFSSNFYKSYDLDLYLYEISQDSVYTVVGDNASERMLKEKKESTNILKKEKLANIFVEDNDSKQTYSNHGNKDFEEYMKKVKNYPYILEINFKSKSMYLLQDNKRVAYKTTQLGNLALNKKENVTTYIAIPDKEVISKNQGNSRDRLYINYKEYLAYRNKIILLVGSKVLAGLVLIGMGVLQVLKNKKNIKNAFSACNILSMIGIATLFIISNERQRANILYIPINTIVTFIICFFSIYLIRYIINNNIELKKNKVMIKYIVTFISIIVIQILLSIGYIFAYSSYVYNVPVSMIVLGASISILINLGLLYYLINMIKKAQSIQK